MAIFYHWKPSVFLAGANYIHVPVPQNISFCQNAWGKGVKKCNEKQTLTKIVSPRLGATMPAVSTFLQEFSFNAKHLDALLQKHPSHRGSQSQNTTVLAACAWVRENEAVWGSWIVAARHSTLAESGQSRGGDEKEGEGSAIDALLLVLIIALILVAATVLVGCRCFVRLKRKTTELKQKNVELARTHSADLDAELGFKPGESPSRSKRMDSLTEVTPRAAATWLIRFDELEIGTMLGRGGFGSVRRGRFRGCDVAIKSIHSTDFGYEASSSSASDKAAA